MKPLQRILSDFINLIFAPKEREEETVMRSWGEIILVLIVFAFLIGIGVITA